MFGFSLGVMPVFVGWSTGTTNPFTVQIAQQIAELPIGSGLGLRLIIFAIGIFLGFSYLMRYGNRVKHKKIKPLLDPIEETHIDTNRISDIKLTSKHIKILITYMQKFKLLNKNIANMFDYKQCELIKILSKKYPYFKRIDTIITNARNGYLRNNRLIYITFL